MMIQVTYQTLKKQQLLVRLQQLWALRFLAIVKILAPSIRFQKKWVILIIRKQMELQFIQMSFQVLLLFSHPLSFQVIFQIVQLLKLRISQIQQNQVSFILRAMVCWHLIFMLETHLLWLNQTLIKDLLNQVLQNQTYLIIQLILDFSQTQLSLKSFLFLQCFNQLRKEISQPHLRVWLIKQIILIQVWINLLLLINFIHLKKFIMFIKVNQMHLIKILMVSYFLLLIYLHLILLYLQLKY